METRSNHLVLGAATLAFLLGGLAFVMWLAEAGIGQTRYRLAFEQSVAGLSVGSPVRVNGVRVGNVEAIALDPERPGRAIVSIAVDAEAPLHADATASLALESIAAGRLYVALDAGSAGTPRLVPREGKTPREIATEPSRVAELIDAAPAVMERLLRVGDGLAQLLEDNAARIAAIGRNLEAITAPLAERRERIGTAIDDAAAAAAALRGASGEAEDLLAQLRRAAQRAAGTLAGAEDVIEDDVAALIGAGTHSLAGLQAAAAELEALAAENRAPLKALTTEGFLEARHLVNETRLLVEEMRTFAELLRRDPSRLLRGRESATFRPEGRR